MKKVLLLSVFVSLGYLLNAQTLEIIGNGNLRSGPSTTNEIIGKVSTGTKVTQIVFSNDWYKVELPNKTSGWIYKSLIKNEKQGKSIVQQKDGVPNQTSKVAVIDSTQIFIDATIKAIRTSSIKMISNNAVGTIVISKEHPLLVNLIKSTEPNSDKIENYGSIGIFDKCQVSIYSNSSMKLNQVQIGMQLGTEMVSMSSVKGYIQSGDCELTGNYSVNGKPITFENTKIVYEDNINVGKVNEGAVCSFDNKIFRYLNGSWVLNK